MPGPLLTAPLHGRLVQARDRGVAAFECTLDLGCSTTLIEPGPERWSWRGRAFPYLQRCREHTVYHWTGSAFEPVARFAGSLVKLVPTDWGPPTFEIDGIKMLPTARVSPYADAERKVGLIEPRGKSILDTCGGLGYFAAWCLRGAAARVLSCERNPDVLWLRSLNPWSPECGAPAAAVTALTLKRADITEEITALPAGSFDAVLHDPPRFGIAGELYSQWFYDQLARVLRRGGRLFHYTGAPQQVSRGRDLAREVARRLGRSGFTTEFNADGVLARKSADR